VQLDAGALDPAVHVVGGGVVPPPLGSAIWMLLGTGAGMPVEYSVLSLAPSCPGGTDVRGRGGTVMMVDDADAGAAWASVAKGNAMSRTIQPAETTRAIRRKNATRKWVDMMMSPLIRPCRARRQSRSRICISINARAPILA
jgi:hypothetical protein